MSEAHSLRITLSGPGGHGAIPSATGDVIKATADLVTRLGTVAQGLTYEGANCVCSAGMLSAGTAVNVVPTTAVVSGTLRTFTEEQRREAVDRLRAVCAGVGEAHGVHVDLELPEHTPQVVNDGPVTDLVEAVAQGLLGRRPRPPHAAIVTERRRERIPQAPTGVLLLRRRGQPRRDQRHPPQPHLLRGGRVAARRGRCRPAQRHRIGRPVTRRTTMGA